MSESLWKVRVILVQKMEIYAWFCMIFIVYELFEVSSFSCKATKSQVPLEASGDFLATTGSAFPLEDNARFLQVTSG